MPGACSKAAAPGAERKLARGPLRVLLLALAWTALALGMIGVVLPGLPTVPFILLAGWAALHSSAGLNQWLLAHRLFGPMLRDWRDQHSVSRRAKRLALASMTLCSIILFATASGPWPVAATATMAAVAIWLWRRPEPGPA